MPSNARVKQILQLCDVERQRRIEYKSERGVLMIVRDNSWTNTVEKGIALAQAVQGATDYAVETVEEIPEEILKTLTGMYGRAGATAGSAGSSQPKDYKLIFVPDDEDREYLVFDRALTLEQAKDVQNELEKET